MGFIKKLFDNESTVVGLCDLRKKQSKNLVYETKSYVLDQLFMERPEDNVLLQRVL